MDESILETSIAEYKSQLTQIQALIATADDLTKLDLYDLEKDLMEMIKIAEDSLLSLKKQKLLAMLNETDSSSVDDVAEPSSGNTGLQQTDEIPEVDNNIDDPELDFVGVKCRVKYTQDWGSFQYHNAMILSCDVDDSLGDCHVKARVLFLNPIHISMVPCKYYLNAKCDYDATCKYSHGYSVDIDELEEYDEPDFSLLRKYCRCLAKFEADGVWYPATVDKIHEDQVTVSFDAYKEESLTLDFHSILPMPTYLSDGSSEDESDDVTDSHGSLPELSSKTISMSGPMGEWEQYTNGFGSKLMMKMGYIFGKGLGKDGQGKIEPVEIKLLPPGKSLDYIAELREKGKIKDPLKKKKHTKSGTKTATTESAFEIINRLTHKQSAVGSSNEFSGSASKVSIEDSYNEFSGSTSKFSIEDSYKSLKKHLKRRSGDVSKKNKDNKKLNLEMFKISEKMTSLQKQLTLQKEALGRNPGDTSVSRTIKQNIEATETEIDRIKQIDTSLQNKLQMKNQSKKLTVF